MHVNEYLDRSDYEGKYEILIGNYIGCNIYPGAEEPCDWLGCP
jgi:hypothetical protein